eukprot:6194719-Pleurochrysis_carterae.AAC.1
MTEAATAQRQHAQTAFSPTTQVAEGRAGRRTGDDDDGKDGGEMDDANDGESALNELGKAEYVVDSERSQRRSPRCVVGGLLLNQPRVRAMHLAMHRQTPEAITVLSITTPWNSLSVSHHQDIS